MWFISSNSINGKTMYIASRIKDPNQLNHSGNWEMRGNYTEDKAEAQELVDKLNAEAETDQRVG